MKASIVNQLLQHKNKKKILSKIEKENKTRLTISKVELNYFESILIKTPILGNDAKNLIGASVFIKQYTYVHKCTRRLK